MARTKKNVETGDGTFDVKAFANAMVELHDQESLPIDKVKELLTESMLKSYKDWWCIKNGFKNNKELNNSADLKATIISIGKAESIIFVMLGKSFLPMMISKTIFIKYLWKKLKKMEFLNSRRIWLLPN